VTDSGRGVTRRHLLAQGGLAGAGLGLGAAGGFAIGRASADDGEAPSQAAATVPFHGEHQAGIATAAQDRLHFAAFDLTTDRAGDLRDLLRAWTDAAARMTAGEPVGPRNDDQLAPPEDTGEAFGLPASELTVTFGFGPGVFERDGEDRLGLAARRPAALRDIPQLPGDLLRPELSGGDLCVQACANDPQVVFHAVRDLARIARGTAVMRWSQLGFGRTSSTSTSQATPRNLMGFKDGTLNIVAEDNEAMDRFVWLDDSERQAWMRGGTYMVTRRIEMLLEIWDRSSLQDQEQTIGRDKYAGAPLGESAEFDTPDFAAKKSGELVIPADAHVRLAHPDFNAGERIMRRGYSFTDGVIEELGELDAGLFFICFQRAPERQFTAIQRRLGSHDALNEYIKHTGSAIFAIPPGASPGGYVGEGLFATT
jgi:deferrochelatase/peroxidase EfeB